MRGVRKSISIGWVAVAVVFAMVGPLLLFNGGEVRVAFIAVPLVLVAIFVVLEGFFLRSDYLARWSKAHGVTVTQENRDVLFRYLRRARAIRATGGFMGYATFVIWDGVSGGGNSSVGWIGATFGGYLLGAAAAEFWAFRARPGVARVASLTPRQISTYVPRFAVVLMRIAALGTVALVVSWRFIPGGRHPIFPGNRLPARPDLTEELVWAGIAIAVAALVEATAHRIVRRPQAAVSEAFVEADDAIRSTAMHGVVGAGLALQLGILSRGAGQWNSFTGSGAWHAVLIAVSMICGFGAVFAWLHLGIDQKWVVRRTESRQEVTA